MNSSPHCNEIFFRLSNCDSGKPSSIGELSALKTKEEVETRFQPVEAFIATVPTSRASVIVKAIDSTLRETNSEGAQSLQHLRRFVKFEYLPDYLQDQLIRTFPAPHSDHPFHQVEDANQKDGCNNTGPGPASLHLLICATTDLSLERIRGLLAPDGLPLWKNEEASFLSITVPGRPPTSEVQAKQWSQQYWPTIYKKHNPFGAHPSIVSRAAAEIEENVNDFMNLATEVGQQVSEACVGESIGAVVVDRNEAGKPAVVMVAGDARWNLADKNPERKNGSGNVMAHAVMRAIALIANKRREIASNPPTTKPDMLEQAFSDKPLTPLERRLYSTSNMKLGGYLCLDLEFYLTHEPCVMCSMALLHSRAGRVIYEKQMVFTGGLTAGEDEDQDEVPSGLGYGLFWRPTLNWKFLAWQWTRAMGSPLRSLETMHA